MAIPDIAEFREILSELALAPNEVVEHSSSVRIPFLPAIDEIGYVKEHEIWLHYPAGTKLPFARLIDRINKELHGLRHPRHDDFALFALAFAILMSPCRGEIIWRLNKVIALICDASVILYYILALRFPEKYKFEFPPFRIGPLRTEKLKYNSEKAESDFYSRYHDRLANSWAIERQPLNTKVFDISRIREEIFGDSVGDHEWRRRAWESLVNGYFSLQNTILFEEFQTELVSSQSVLLAIGAPFFDTRTMYMLSSVIRTHRVAIFVNIGSSRAGFVAPSGVGPLLLDVAGIHERIPKALKELREVYGLEQLDNSPLHKSIKLFADFIARARRHEIDHRSNEALLHFVIALELIFGERQAIQKSVSNRVALITYREAGRSFHEQRNWIDGIYDLRSKYVHAGTEISEESRLELLRILCEQVFRCLLRLQAAVPDRAARGEEALTGWLRGLDYLVAGIMAGKAPTETQLAEVFIS